MYNWCLPMQYHINSCNSLPSQCMWRCSDMGIPYTHWFLKSKYKKCCKSNLSLHLFHSLIQKQRCWKPNSVGRIQTSLRLNQRNKSQWSISWKMNDSESSSFCKTTYRFHNYNRKIHPSTYSCRRLCHYSKHHHSGKGYSHTHQYLKFGICLHTISRNSWFLWSYQCEIIFDLMLKIQF